jgi:hypothetical protein
MMKHTATLAILLACATHSAAAWQSLAPAPEPEKPAAIGPSSQVAIDPEGVCATVRGSTGETFLIPLLTPSARSDFSKYVAKNGGTIGLCAEQAGNYQSGGE